MNEDLIRRAREVARRPSPMDEITAKCKCSVMAVYKAVSGRDKSPRGLKIAEEFRKYAKNRRENEE